jgi:hypothetical protein
VLVGAACIWLLFVAVMELRLFARGFKPTIVDSDRLWMVERRRAADLGERALIVVGGSRAQLSLDLETLRRRTGKIPVQLAIDGSSFMPVLKGLAEDPGVVGTVLVDYTDHVIAEPDRRDEADRLEALYERRGARLRVPDFQTTEAILGDLLHDHLRSYADGARPLTSLLVRILQPGATPQYIVTLPDRSRLADYRRVAMPGFYYGRVLRNLGQDVPMAPGSSWADLDAEIRKRVDRIAPVESPAFLDNSRRIAGWARAIEARGGRVIFFVPPMSGLVRAINDKQFPRERYWDPFAKIVGGHASHFEDVPAMASLVCPDGSHLDYRDRARYTDALVTALSAWLR